MDKNNIEEARKLLQNAHDVAQRRLLQNQSEYGFGLVDGLFAALTILHELENE